MLPRANVAVPARPIQPASRGRPQHTNTPTALTSSTQLPERDLGGPVAPQRGRRTLLELGQAAALGDPDDHQCDQPRGDDGGPADDQEQPDQPEAEPCRDEQQRDVRPEQAEPADRDGAHPGHVSGQPAAVSSRLVEGPRGVGPVLVRVARQRRRSSTEPMITTTDSRKNAASRPTRMSSPRRVTRATTAPARATTGPTSQTHRLGAGLPGGGPEGGVCLAAGSGSGCRKAWPDRYQPATIRNAPRPKVESIARIACRLPARRRRSSDAGRPAAVRGWPRPRAPRG